MAQLTAIVASYQKQLKEPRTDGTNVTEAEGQGKIRKNGVDNTMPEESDEKSCKIDTTLCLGSR
jgi:hypothetical protein